MSDEKQKNGERWFTAKLLTKQHFCLNRTPSFPHDFSGTPVRYSNLLFLLVSLDTRLRGYDVIFLKFCAEIQSRSFVRNLKRRTLVRRLPFCFNSSNAV